MTHVSLLRALRGTIAPVAMLALLMQAPLGAASAEETDVEERGGPSTALVRVDGRPILRIRGFASLPADERARAIEARIEAFAGNRSMPASVLRLEENARGTAIMAGPVTLLTITDADAALEELGRQALAEAARAQLAETVDAWRAERTSAVRLQKAGRVAVATLLLAAVLWLLVRVSRRLREAFVAHLSARVRPVGVQEFEFVNAERIHAALRAVPRVILGLLAAAVVYVYLEFVLRLFPLTRPIGERLFDLVVGPLETLGLAFLGELPNLAFLTVLVLVVRYLLKLTRMYFEAIGRGTVRFDQFDAEWAIPTYKVVRIFVVAFALVVAYPYIPGSESAAFKGVSVMLGVLFSLGSSSVISNVIAGYSMTYRRAFRRGDRIRVGDVTGDVVEPRLLVTTLRTPKNELVVVPNSEILGSSIVNYSALARESGLILHTTVGIGYETPWRQVEAMLLMAAGRTEGLKREPAPFVLQTSLGDFCVTYEVNAYTDDPQQMARQYSALHANILDVFNEYGVQIMTPAYEGDPPEPKVVRPADWYAAPARPSPAAPGASPSGPG